MKAREPRDFDFRSPRDVLLLLAASAIVFIAMDALYRALQIPPG